MSRALKKARGVAPMPGMMMPVMMSGMMPGMGMMQPPPLTAGDVSGVEEHHGPAAAPTPARATVVAEHEPPSAGPAIAGHLPEDGQHHHLPSVPEPVPERPRLDLRAEEDPVEEKIKEACHRTLAYFVAFSSLPRSGFVIVWW